MRASETEKEREEDERDRLREGEREREREGGRESDLPGSAGMSKPAEPKEKGT